MPVQKVQIRPRRTGIQGFSVALNSSTWTQVVGPNPKRVAIIISPEQSSTRVVLVQVGTQTQSAHFVIVPGASPTVVTIDQLGDVIKEAWFALAVAGTPSANLAEVTNLEGD